MKPHHAFLAAALALTTTGCTTSKALEETGNRFSEGDVGWGLFNAVVGVPVALIYDVFTLGGTADPETGVKSVMTAGYQAEGGDVSGALGTVGSAMAGSGRSSSASYGARAASSDASSANVGAVYGPTGGQMPLVEPYRLTASDRQGLVSGPHRIMAWQAGGPMHQSDFPLNNCLQLIGDRPWRGLEGYDGDWYRLRNTCGKEVFIGFVGGDADYVGMHGSNAGRLRANATSAKPVRFNSSAVRYFTCPESVQVVRIYNDIQHYGCYVMGDSSNGVSLTKHYL